MNFSDWLQDKILKSGKTRKEVAKLARIPKNRMDDICSGLCPPSYESRKISKALDISYDEMEGIISGDIEPTLEPIKRQSGTDFPLKQATNQLKSKHKTPFKEKEFKLIPPKNKHCRRCGVESGTECFRHSESRIIKFLVGGGIIGSKIPDILTGWLCEKCDQELSEPLSKNATKEQEEKHAYEWLLSIVKTHLI